MEDFLSLPDDYERKAKDGKKHVSIISILPKIIYFH